MVVVVVVVTVAVVVVVALVYVAAIALGGEREGERARAYISNGPRPTSPSPQVAAATSAGYLGSFSIPLPGRTFGCLNHCSSAGFVCCSGPCGFIYFNEGSGAGARREKNTRLVGQAFIRLPTYASSAPPNLNLDQ